MEQANDLLSPEAPEDRLSWCLWDSPAQSEMGRGQAASPRGLGRFAGVPALSQRLPATGPVLVFLGKGEPGGPFLGRPQGKRAASFQGQVSRGQTSWARKPFPCGHGEHRALPPVR